MFTLSFDRSKRLIDIKLSGLLSEAEVGDLRLAVLAAMREHGHRPGTFLALLDHSDCPIQPQAVHGALLRFGRDPAVMPARLAILSGDSPGRMQSRRHEVGCPTRLFDRRSEAVAWLLEPSDRIRNNEAGAPAATAIHW
jgi:hypothetical protein